MENVERVFDGSPFFSHQFFQFEIRIRGFEVEQEPEQMNGRLST
jgi:hypothetical protein